MSKYTVLFYSTNILSAFFQ